MLQLMVAAQGNDEAWKAQRDRLLKLLQS